MGNLVAIYAAGLSNYAFAPLPGGGNAFARVLTYAAALPEVSRIVVLGAKRVPEGQLASAEGGPQGPVPITLVNRELWDVRALIEELMRVTTTDGATGKESGDLFYLFGDYPLYDQALAARMHANHKRYYAEYTFADGYPLGLTPEILTPNLIHALPRLVRPEDGPVTRDTLFALIQRDINSFDIETEIAPRDLRMSRVQLSCDTKRNYTLVGRVMEAGGRDEASVMETVERRGELQRTLPAFVEIQITDGMTQEVVYSPYTKLVPDALGRRNEMSIESFARAVDQVAAYAEDAVISLSLWGEPALHSKLDLLLAEVYRHEGLSALRDLRGGVAGRSSRRDRTVDRKSNNLDCRS